MRMLRVLLFLFFSLCFSFSFSQNGGWWPVDRGVYGPGDGVLALCPYDSLLFVGGSFDTAGGIAANGIAQWNGKNWGTVGQGVRLTNGSISALAIYHGKLYAGGEFDSAGGKAANAIAVWDGTSWSSVGNWIGTRFAIVDGFCVYNNELYATGGFDSAGAVPVNNIAKWNDTAWSPVGLGLTGALSGGVCMAVYHGKLYVGGGFDSAGGLPVSNIASWDGTNWDSVGHTKWDGGIYALCSYDSILYMGGVFHYPGFDSLQDLNHINFIAQWNDSIWDSVGNSYPYWPTYGGTQIFSLSMYNGNLIVGGSSDSGNIARWNGSSWSTMDSGTNGWLEVSTVYKKNLYIGGGIAGGFDHAGGRFAEDIAVWANDTFTEVDEVRAKSEVVKAYPNPSNGVFTLVIASETKQSPSNIEIYNVLGEKVYQRKASLGSNEIDLSNQPSGVYFYRVTSAANGLIGEGKLIIQR